MKIRLIILTILFFCCKDTARNTQSNGNYMSENNVNFDANDFFKNFELLSMKEFVNYKVTSIPSNTIPSKFIVNKLMIPVNAIPYENSYIRTTYYKGVRAELDNNSYLISILKTYDLHSYQILWCIVNKDIIRSKIIVEQYEPMNISRFSKYENNMITIENKYIRNFENGLDKNNNPINHTSRYSIVRKNDFFVFLEK